MIYTVTFNPSVDCILHIGDVKFGGLNRASKEEFFFSGKGINVSTVLHRLGAATSAITFVGGFTGSETERVLSPDVPLDVIRLAEGCTRINVKLKAPDGSETEINAPGAPIGEDGMRKLYARLSVLGSGDTLVLSGSVPSDVGTNVYSEIFASLEGRGVRFCADAAGALLRGALSRSLFVIKPNVAELEETLGRSVNGEAEICRAARELQRMGSEYVLVTAGADGAYLFAPGDRAYHASVPSGEVIATIGAGDSTLGGFLGGFDSGLGEAESLRLAAACGTATASSVWLASREKIEETLGMVTVHEL
mgnify:FL=1